MVRPADQLPPGTGASSRSLVRAVFGVVLMAVGILLVGGAGLCSAVFVVNDYPSSDSFGLALMFGGPFIAVGALLIWGGRALRRSAGA